MKLQTILEKIAAEVHKPKQLKIKYASPTQQVVNIDTTLDKIDQEMMRHPDLRRHLKVIQQYINQLDRNTLKTYNITEAGWDILIDQNTVTLRNDQGDVIKKLKL